MTGISREAYLGGGMLERRLQGAVSVQSRGADGGDLKVEGYACVTNRSYPIGNLQEVVAPGSFRRTLTENPKVVLLIGHEGLPLASTSSGTLALAEDATGLHFSAELDPDDPDSRMIHGKIKRGLVSEASFAFRVTSEKYSDNGKTRTITGVTLDRGDVTICPEGANPFTSVQARAAELAAQDARRQGDYRQSAAHLNQRDRERLALLQRDADRQAGRPVGRTAEEIIAAESARLHPSLGYRKAGYR